MKKRNETMKGRVLALTLALTANLWGGDLGKSATDAVNFCPAGLAFGVVAVNYEHLFARGHGLMARYDYEEVPEEYTDADIKASARAYFLNYRWHLEETMEGCFVGVYGRHRVYDGSGRLDGERFDFRISEQTLGVNAGKRWVWENGLNLNLAFGYGGITVDRDRPADGGIRAAIADFEGEYGKINPFYGEFSVGYTF